MGIQRGASIRAEDGDLEVPAAVSCFVTALATDANSTCRIRASGDQQHARLARVTRHHAGMTPNTGAHLLDGSALGELARLGRESYANASPFAHAVWDDFFPGGVLDFEYA